ncbi:MAG: hypothetical protein ACXW3Z_05950 [Limisphaerales bacterium]
MKPNLQKIPAKATASVLILAIAASLVTSDAGAAEPKRLKRAESFLGVHFDFHAGPDCKEIGKNTTPEMVERIIDLVGPDYLQIDCKGHRGLSSYPTKVGNPAPGFVGDPLKIWREVTARRGVALYMHYSGVWDSEAIIQHPDWGAINADGKTNGNATSFFSAYADELLIPQIRELAGQYRVDGAWIDGECWASVPDYGTAALKAFREATGIQNVPRKPTEPHWFEFLEFNRELFRMYLRHYIAEVKKTNPEFQLCSNWAYTDHMAEAVNAPVDFLSGDYSPEDSVNSARLSGRYLVRQGKPWDLMAWSFIRNKDANGRTQKSAVQLQQEAAIVVALGGGFQAYFKQMRDGSIYEEQMPIMAQVAKFCRARQTFSHRAMPVPQVGLLLSTAGHYRRINGLFNRDLSRINGVLQALLENQESVEVVGEHQLAGRLSEYPLIVVPEWEFLYPKFRDDLVAYVRGGGNLLLIGSATARLFVTELGLSPEALTELQSKASAANPIKTVKQFGKGKIAAVPFSLGQNYLQTRSPQLRDFMNSITRELFPDPIVQVKASADVDVVVNRLGNKLNVHLVNTAGPHREANTIFDEIPPIGPLQVAIRAKEKPSRVTLEPGGEALSPEYANGTIRVTIPRLEIHRTITVE